MYRRRRDRIKYSAGVTLLADSKILRERIKMMPTSSPMLPASSRFKIGAILFLDISGYSSLNEHQIGTFIDIVLPLIGSTVSKYRDQMIELNTWGDAIMAAADDPVDIANLALELRDFFNQFNWEQLGLPTQLRCRISLHAGRLRSGHDPVRNLPGVIGTQVNLAARIEPASTPGEIWTTATFRDVAVQGNSNRTLEFDDLGVRPLAKNAGSERLYRLCRRGEQRATPQNGVVAATSLPLLLDLVGVGAFNIDYIVTSKVLRTINPQLAGETDQRFEYGSEELADIEYLQRFLHSSAQANYNTSLGGSSFNVINAAKFTQPSLKIGMIGVAGRTDVAGLSFEERLHALHIDTSCLKVSEDRAGVCISVIDDFGERSLKTSPGANREGAEYFIQNRDKIIHYLSHSRVVHITSFFDENTPSVLAGIIIDAKAINPWLRVSFDPGHQWIVKGELAMKKIMKVCDYLFLNWKEFSILGGESPGADPKILAQNVLNQCSSFSTVVVAKKYDEIVLFYRVLDRLVQHSYPNTIIPPSEVEDSTGAGDVFAAGFLISRLVPGMERRHGMQLGLDLVHAKLRSPGHTAFVDFRAIFQERLKQVVREIENPT